MENQEYMLRAIELAKRGRGFTNPNPCVGAVIVKNGKIIGRGIRKGGIYVMKLGNKPEDRICLMTLDENSTLWHRRLGHANMQQIQSLASKELVRNLPNIKYDKHFCDACKIGKQVHHINIIKEFAHVRSDFNWRQTVQGSGAGCLCGGIP